MAARVEPAAHRDARTVLEEHQQSVSEIYLVDTDCVLFVTKTRVPMTAWLTVCEANTNTGRTLKIEVERGFVADRGNPTLVRRPNPTTPFPLNRNTKF